MFTKIKKYFKFLYKLYNISSLWFHKSNFMKSTDFQIQIPKPCDANWNEMTPNEQGKFCSLCDKTVVDFTKMSDEEIKHFFKIKKKEERVCGHFYASQVVVPVPKYHQFLIDLYTKIETEISIYLFRKPALFGFGLLMTMVGCETKTSGEVKAQSKKDTTETAVKDSVVNSETKTIDTIQTNEVRKVFLPPIHKGKAELKEELYVIEEELTGVVAISPSQLDSLKADTTKTKKGQ